MTGVPAARVSLVGGHGPDEANVRRRGRREPGPLRSGADDHQLLPRQPRRLHGEVRALVGHQPPRPEEVLRLATLHRCPALDLDRGVQDLGLPPVGVGDPLHDGGGVAEHDGRVLRHAPVPGPQRRQHGLLDGGTRLLRQPRQLDVRTPQHPRRGVVVDDRRPAEPHGRPVRGEVRAHQQQVRLDPRRRPGGEHREGEPRPVRRRRREPRRPERPHRDVGEVLPDEVLVDNARDQLGGLTDVHQLAGDPLRPGPVREPLVGHRHPHRHRTLLSISGA